MFFFWLSCGRLCDRDLRFSEERKLGSGREWSEWSESVPRLFIKLEQITKDGERPVGVKAVLRAKRLEGLLLN